MKQRKGGKLMKNTTMLYISLGTNSIFLERIHHENIHALKDYEKFTLSKPQNTQKMYTDLADKSTFMNVPKPFNSSNLTFSRPPTLSQERKVPHLPKPVTCIALSVRLLLSKQLISPSPRLLTRPHYGHHFYNINSSSKSIYGRIYLLV